MISDEEIVQAIHEECGDVEINRVEGEDIYDLKAFEIIGADNVDDGTYIIGDYDTAYAGAIQEAERTWEDCYSDEDKVNWLQEWNWPGVDKKGVCYALMDDPSDYEDEEEPWQPESIEEYIDMMGYKNASECFSWDFLRPYVDTSELAEFVVDNDGVASGLARYDGAEVNFGQFYGYRVDA